VRTRRALAWGVLLTVVFQVLIGFVPLFGGPGYEHALATGLLVPGIVLCVVGLDANVHVTVLGPRGVVHGALYGAGLSLLSLLIAFLHLLHARACAPWSQVPYFALSAFPGCTLAGAWGVYVGVLARSQKRRRLFILGLGIAIPLGSALISLARFIDSPMIYAYDPFVGFFSGTLYDTIVAPSALVTYRAGTVLTLFALIAFAWALQSRSAFAVLTASTLAAASLTHTAYGESLGHWSSRESIGDALGGVKSGARCTVVFPRGLRSIESELLLRDCEGQLADVEQVLGVRGPDRVTALFFRDPDEKRRLMGAAQVYIAKPWRNEVYLQLGGFPHPVLGHELAHVVAGSMGRGPFRISGAFFGLWPNPGLIEGVATAASPDDGDLSDLQWAKAMKELKMLPRMERVFSMRFMSESSSKSYTLAGAFVAWTLQTFGKPVIHQWYGGASLETLTAKSWDTLNLEFGVYLDRSVSLPPQALAFAKAKFERPGVFARACPHVVDEERAKADQSRDACDVLDATARYNRVLERDPNDFASRLGLGQTELRCGEAVLGKRAFEALPAQTPKPYRDRAREAIADTYLMSGRLEAAAEFEALAEGAVDEDQARSYDVKAFAAKHPEVREAVVALLLGGKEQRTPDMLLAGFTLGKSAAHPLVRYLVSKNLAQHALYTQAEEAMDKDDASELPIRVQRERLRQQVVIACGLGSRTQLEALEKRNVDAFFAGTAGGRKEAYFRAIRRCLLGLPPAVLR
jgi:hypothetical protein